MSVEIVVRLSEREADALLRAVRDAGWYSRPSLVLQSADFKIRNAVISARAKTPRESGQ